MNDDQYHVLDALVAGTTTLGTRGAAAGIATGRATEIGAETETVATFVSEGEEEAGADRGIGIGEAGAERGTETTGRRTGGMCGMFSKNPRHPPENPI